MDFLIVVPILAAGLSVVIYKTMPLFKRVFKKYDNLNSSIQENIKGMRVVKSFVREGYEQEKFNAAAEDVCADFTKAERILALNSPMMQFCIYTVMVFVMITMAGESGKRIAEVMSEKKHAGKPGESDL